MSETIVVAILGVGGLTGLVIALVATIRFMVSIVDKLSKTVDRTIDERNDADKSRLTEMEGRLRETQARLDLERRVNELTRDQQADRDKITVLELDNQARKDLLNTWETRIEELETQRAAIQKRADELAEQVEGLQAEKTSTNKRIGDLEGQIIAITQERDGLIKERDRLSDLLSKQAEQFAKTEGELRERIIKLEDANKENPKTEAA